MAHVWVFDPLFFAIRRSIFGGNFHVTRGDGIREVQETLVGLGLTIVDLDLDPGWFTYLSMAISGTGGTYHIYKAYVRPM